MSATHISSTKRGSFEALRFQGILATESYAQLQSMVKNSLSDEHALLFAEPVHERFGDHTDWYSDRSGKAERLIDLSEEEQQPIKKRIASLAEDVKQLADDLSSDDSQAKRIRGNILKLALLCPGVENVYVIDGQPVIIAWGFAPAGAGAEPEDLIRLGTAASLGSEVPKVSEPDAPPPSAAPPPSPAPASGIRWLGMVSSLLLGLLAALALYFLLCMLFGPSGCVSPGSLPDWCSGPLCPRGTPAASSLLAAKEQEQELQSRLDALKAELAEKMAQCPRTPPSPDETPAPIVPDTAQTAPETPEPKGPITELPLEGRTESPEEKPEEHAPEPAPVETPSEGSTLAEAEQPAPLPEASPAQEPPTEEPPTETPPVEEVPAEEPPALDQLMPTTPEPKPEDKPVETPKQKPAEKPKAEPKPLVEDKPHKPGEEMRIPDKARQDNDTSFLQGCWTSESGLVSTRGEPVHVKYCFGADGAGTRTITETRSDTHCSGSVKAQFDSSGKLVFDARRSACNTGGAYVPQLVDCSPDKTGTAQCYGTSKSGKRWKAVFKKD